MRDPDTGVAHFARVKVPNNVPAVRPGRARSTGRRRSCRSRTSSPRTSRSSSRAWTSLDHHLFRVTRNADVEVEEDRDEDLLQALERELARRRFGPAVRLEVTESMDPQILEVLLSELEMQPGRRAARARACSTWPR